MDIFEVSSRAPVWGASPFSPPYRTQFPVSSRAPVWGASRGKQTDPEGKGGFKSCPRVGGIRRVRHSSGLPKSFKSCPRVGGIRRKSRSFDLSQCFKSCPRVGGIIAAALFVPSIANLFQVVPPCGGHLLFLPYAAHFRVSSRAPVWGASTVKGKAS